VVLVERVEDEVLDDLRHLLVGVSRRHVVADVRDVVVPTPVVDDAPELVADLVEQELGQPFGVRGGRIHAGGLSRVLQVSSGRGRWWLSRSVVRSSVAWVGESLVTSTLLESGPSGPRRASGVHSAAGFQCMAVGAWTY